MMFLKMLSVCDDVDVLIKYQSMNNLFQIIKYGIAIIIVIILIISCLQKNVSLQELFIKVFINILLVIIIIFLPNLIFSSLRNSQNLEIGCIPLATEERINALQNNIEENNVQNVKMKLESLKQSLNINEYNELLNIVNLIKDDKTRTEIENEVRSLKQYIDINSEIIELKSKYDHVKYYNMFDKIASLSDANYKNKLESELLSLGYGKKMDVHGQVLKNYGRMEYLVTVPPHPLEKMPLLISFGVYYNRSTMYDYGEYFMLEIDHKTLRCETNECVNSVKAIMDSVIGSYQIDPDRVMVTGFSYGGSAAWNVAGVYGEYFSAIVPISGVPDIFGPTKFTRSYVWANAGSGETFGERMQNYVDSINRNGGNAKFSFFPGAHGAQASNFFRPEVIKWALAQKRKP